jgi:hypothetical protein
MLLSSDAHLRGINQEALRRLLDGCSVETLIIFSPWKIVKDFYNSVH